jgi:hypothetical protein
MKIRYFPTQGQEPIVISVSTDFDEEVPQWDVAIEALIREEFQRHRRFLLIADFDRLAQQYAIRFDDIITTVFQLAVHGKWIYLDEHGTAQSLTRERVARLSAQGRLERKDVEKFTGGWRPAA